jgi:hypothetical protein
MMCATVSAVGQLAPPAAIPFIALSITLAWSMAVYTLIEKPNGTHNRWKRTIVEIAQSEPSAVN